MGVNTIPAVIQGGATLIGPAADGSANQLLTTDGSGNLSFGAATVLGPSFMSLGGTAGTDVAIKNQAGWLDIRTGSDSGAATCRAAYFISYGDVRAGSTSFFHWSSRSEISSPADGSVLLQNAANTDFSLLQFGGTTSSFPALKRSTTALHARLADDSDYCNFIASTLIASTHVQAPSTGQHFWFQRTEMSSPSDGNLMLSDDAATDFSLLQFGGTTSSFPALKRSTTILQARLADDSAYADMEAASFDSAEGGRHSWRGRAVMKSPSDGVITLFNDAESDFARMCFGGTTAAFPAIKRNSAQFRFVTANDAAYVDCVALRFTATEYIDVGATSYYGWAGRSAMLSPADGAVRLTNDAQTGGVYLESFEIAAPGAGAANTGRLYFADNGGKTTLYAVFPTGAAQAIAAEP